MVNTHAKFPNDVRHNTYYAADKSNLRDATEEEVKNTASLPHIRGENLKRNRYAIKTKLRLPRLATKERSLLGLPNATMTEVGRNIFSTRVKIPGHVRGK